MGDEPRNAASVFIRDAYPRFGELASLVADGRQDWRVGFAEDFRREDRRGLVGIETAGPAELIDSLLAYWDLGEGEPTFRVVEVVAVRGDRCVLFRAVVEFPGGQSTESLLISAFTKDMKLARVIVFDPDDIDEATADLDRLHAEIEADRS